MKRFLKFTAKTILLLIVIIVLLVGSLYIPAVQNWLVNYVARQATEGTGLSVHVEQVGLTFPLDLDVRGVTAIDETGDTVLSVRQVVVDLDLTDIFDWQVGIDELTLRDGVVDSKQLVDGMRVKGRLRQIAIRRPNSINLSSNTARLNELSLDNCDLHVHLGATAQTDTTTSESTPWDIRLNRLSMNEVGLTLSTDSSYLGTRIAHLTIDNIVANMVRDSIAIDQLSGRISYLQADTLTIPSVSIESRGVAMHGKHVCIEPLRIQSTGSWMELHADLSTDLSDSLQLGMQAQASRLMMAIVGDKLDLQLPSAPLSMALNARGTAERMLIEGTYIDLHDIVRIDLDGTVLNALTELDAAVTARLQSAAGHANIDASYNHDESYSVQLDVPTLSPRRISRDLPVRHLAMRAAIDGRGLDPLANDAQMRADVRINRCALDSLTLHDIRLLTMLDRGNLAVNINSSDSVARFDSRLDAQLRQTTRGQQLEGTLGIDLSDLNLQAIGAVDSTLHMGTCLHLDITSDLQARHHISGAINDIRLMLPDTTLRPVDMSLEMLMHPDTLHGHFTAGGMYIDAALSGSIEQANRRLARLFAMLDEQLQHRQIDQNQLREQLPRANVNMSLSGRNPVSTMLAVMGYPFADFNMQLSSNNIEGINGRMRLHTLDIGSAILDDIRIDIDQDSTGVRATAQVHNNTDNPQATFDAQLEAWLLNDGAGAHLTFDDADHRRGVDIGAIGTFNDDGLSVRLTPQHPTLAFRGFELNADNYLMLCKDGNLLANLNLLADDGTGLVLYSAEQYATPTPQPQTSTPQPPTSNLKPQNPTIDLTASFQHVNLSEVSAMMPYIPRIGGLLQGDAHYIAQDSTVTVALDAQVQQLSLDDAQIGDIGLMATCIPEMDGTYAIDGVANIRQTDCLMFSGTMGSDDGIQLDAFITDMPANIINCFAGDDIAFGGNINGTLHAAIADDTRLDGVVGMRQFTISSPTYNLNLSLPDETIRLSDNHLLLDNLNFHSTGSQPLVMNGDIDLSDMRLNIGMRARNFQLINAKKTRTSLVYGKMYCNVDTRITGTLDDLHLNGTLGVLGNTDLTYMLKDSPLTVEDRLSELVTFSDFSLDEDIIEEDEVPMDISMNMNVVIDNAARLHCLLSEDRSSYIDIEGGGELSMTYNPLDGMQLGGRYTINSGEMKYQLPIIPLKTFKFENGSYIEFKGKLLNPTLNIAATERMRAQVPDESGATRTVAFDVGLKLSQTLENMGLQFNIDAPEDAEVQNELSMLDETTRGRTAVTMLVTGMYINENSNRASSNDGGFSTESALNALLQSEISSLAGKALNSVDVTFGMDNTTMADGTTQTDYSFSFAKHFWGNRVSVVLGGKVSSGRDAVNDGTTIIDNVSIEYRLDQSATRYVHVFYDKTYESMLDGKITEMGAGIVLRRHTTRLGDLFIFRRRD